MSSWNPEDAQQKEEKTWSKLSAERGDHEADNDICEVIDEFGLQAFEEFCEGDQDEFRWIRIENELSTDLKNITSAEAVREKIEQVRLQQGKFGRADLYPRRWENVAPLIGDAERDKCFNGNFKGIFSIAQFNALAEGLCAGPKAKTPFRIDPGDKRSQKDEKGKYGGFTRIEHPSTVLDFSLRKWRILEVLLGSDDDRPCDLLAVEEIDRYRGFFAPMLQLFGFEGIFVPKPRSPCVRMGWYSDGCSLFWKKDTFEIVSESRREYKVGNQVMILAVLRHRPTQKSIVVAVTHLKAQSNEANERIRRRQVQELVEYVEETVNKVKRTDQVFSVPTIIAGDLNADPPCQVTFGSSSIAGLLKPETGLISAYDLESGELYSTWKTRGTKTVKRVIDYIVYRGNLECEAILGVPPESELEAAKLPGLRNPSDHLMIAAKFKII
jgi:hypothetical protein